MGDNTRPRLRTYGIEYFDPRVDQTGINARYHSGTDNKASRTSESERVTEPLNMNPSGTVRRKGRQG